MALEKTPLFISTNVGGRPAVLDTDTMHYIVCKSTETAEWVVKGLYDGSIQRINYAWRAPAPELDPIMEPCS